MQRFKHPLKCHLKLPNKYLHAADDCLFRKRRFSCSHVH